MQVSAQGELEAHNIDPRLDEIIQIVKNRASETSKAETAEQTRDKIYLDLIDEMQSASYSLEIDAALRAIDAFKDVYQGDAPLDFSNIHLLHLTYARLLSSNATPLEIQTSIGEYTTKGNWFERYFALSLSAHIHSTNRERQAALQKAQLALSLIPTKPDAEISSYVSYTKIRISSLIAHLHNLQGNSELALMTSLDYLRLTEDSPDFESEVDLINNLIYSYSIGRNHEAQLYLSEQLLEIEKSQTSSVPGLSEMRISDVMNSSGRFQEGLDYAELSLSEGTHPLLLRNSQVTKAQHSSLTASLM